MKWDVVKAPVVTRDQDRVTRYVEALLALECGSALELKNIAWLDVKFLRNHCPRSGGRFSVRTKRLPSAGPIERYDAWVIRVE